VRIAAIAWDIDGTLVDSEPRHHRALLQASHRWGVDLADLPDQAFRGIHMGDVWTALSGRFPATLAFGEWLEAINQAYVCDERPLHAIQGAVEAMSAFAAAGLLQICVSNSNRPIVDANIAGLGIAHLLVGSISLDDVEAGKPDPEPYAKACRILDLDPGAVVAVEDSATGLHSANRAGLISVAFSGDRATAGLADLATTDLRQLPGLLESHAAIAARPTPR